MKPRSFDGSHHAFHHGGADVTPLADEEPDPLSPARVIVNGLLLSIPLWLLIIGIAGLGFGWWGR